MLTLNKCFGAVLLAAIFVGASAAQTPPQFASLGDLKLESGQVIRDCRIAYRTFGQLNADKSNAVLFTTWFTGTTADLIESFGPGKLVDTSKYYVVAVDALANGQSCAPSNSKLQPHMKFPRIAIRDMINSQHEFLTRVLHIPHLRAVMGISMGGMQSFQWIVSYPDFMDKAIPMMGSPRLAPYDLLLWQAHLDAIQSDPAWKNGEYTQQPLIPTVQDIDDLALTTPEHYNKEFTREKFFQAIEKRKTPDFDANDRIRQLQAMMAHDVSAPFGGSMEKAAAAVKAQVLVIVGARDQMVTPGPALDFAKLLRAQVLQLDNDCGHIGPGCEESKVDGTIASFLEK
jgi:homoserine O-acetyltransferase